MLDAEGEFWQKKQRNGVVAQLGERLNGIQEAKSSILFSSTRISRVYGLGRKPFFCIWEFISVRTKLHVFMGLFFIFNHSVL